MEGQVAAAKAKTGVPREDRSAGDATVSIERVKQLWYGAGDGQAME